MQRDVEPNVNDLGATLRRAGPPHRRPRSLASSPPPLDTRGGRLVVPHTTAPPRLASEQETAVKGVIIVETWYKSAGRQFIHKILAQGLGFDLRSLRLLEILGALPVRTRLA